MARIKREQYAYPQLNVRVPSDAYKKQLLEEIDKLHSDQNRGRDKNTEYAIKKADIILSALEYGLSAIREGRIRVKTKESRG